MIDIHSQKILILDFGSQYTQLIARRIREMGVYCEIHLPDFSNDNIVQFNPSGIILSGGPETVTVDHTPRTPEIVFTLGKPVLGICYGMQTMALQLGGAVEAGVKREFGFAQVAIREPSELLNGIEDHVTDDNLSLLDVWMSHGDHVSQLPRLFKTIASTTNCPIAGMADEERKFYGLQFHPEVLHTRQGARILEKFVLSICGCTAQWTTKNILQEQIEGIRKLVGNEHVLLGLSGGVDSSVLAVLLHKAIGDQLTCVFVDTGLLRLHEADQVESLFAKHFGMKLICVNAKELFLKELANKSDPEEKRKIIGKLFIDVFEQEAKKIPAVTFLAQGTIYSDVIESAGIKSHHNVGGLPDTLQLKLLEPLRELFKDEVRKIGVELGLPSDMVYRHPFPGPGLGVRILGEVKKEYADLLRKADNIFIEELRAHDLYDKTSQAFAVFLPVKSVGVMGDGRRYDYVVALRAVETIDFMTARWAHLPYEFLDLVSRRIINEVNGISRVVYDISGKPPATIEWE